MIIVFDVIASNKHTILPRYCTHIENWIFEKVEEFFDPDMVVYSFNIPKWNYQMF